MTQKSDLVTSESIIYTYKTHGNASFKSQSDSNSLTIDLEELASGASASQTFSIFGLSGRDLGLTGFNSAFLAGDNVFSVTGANSFAAGASGIYNANFAGLSPSVSTSYSGTYRLTFTDNVAGFTHASSSVGTNYVDLTITAAVAAVPEPETYVMLLAGLGLMGTIARRRRQDLS